MKKLQRPAVLYGICAAMGIVTLFLRVWLLRYGADERGLLRTEHPANLLSFIMTALTLLPCAYAALTHPDSAGCTHRKGPFPAAGWGIGCIGFAASVWYLFSTAQTGLTTVSGIVGIVAFVCMIAGAFSSYSGKKIHYLLSSCILVFLMLLPIQFYQVWSAQPQLPRYFFQLLGSVCVLVWAYQRSALLAGIGCYRAFLLTGAAGVFFCIAAIPGSVQPLFYLTAAVWMLLDSAAVCPAKDDHAAA